MEIVREAVFERLHKELPYTVSIRHVSWRELADGSVRVEHALMVASNSQRKARAAAPRCGVPRRAGGRPC